MTSLLMKMCWRSVHRKDVLLLLYGKTKTIVNMYMYIEQDAHGKCFVAISFLQSTAQLDVCSLIDWRSRNVRTSRLNTKRLVKMIEICWHMCRLLGWTSASRIYSDCIFVDVIAIWPTKCFFESHKSIMWSLSCSVAAFYSFNFVIHFISHSIQLVIFIKLILLFWWKHKKKKNATKVI